MFEEFIYRCSRLFLGEEKRIALLVRSTEKLLDAKKEETAIKRVMAATQEYPTSAEVQLQYAAVMLRTSINLQLRVNRMAGAIEGLRKFIYLCKGDDSRKQPAAEALEEAKKEFQQWKNIFSSGAANISIPAEMIDKMMFDAAWQLFRLEKYSMALPLCTSFTRWAGEPYVLFVKLQCLDKLGRKEETRAACEEAMKQQVKGANYYNTVGAIFHESLKDRERARQCLDKALDIEPDHIAALINRGICRLELGDRSGGRADLERSLKIEGNPRKQEIAGLLNQLDRGGVR